MKRYFVLIILLFVTTTVHAGLWPVPDTGQTKCYDADGNELNPCPKPGEPFYGQDANYSINPRSYTKLDSDGNDLPITATSWTMVRDNVTGLIWEVKTDDGSVHDRDDTYTWDETNTFIDQLNAENFGGYNDWRMPTIKELASITNKGVYNPAIDEIFFPNVALSYYWSGTTHAGNTANAWLINFSYGSDYGSYSKSSSYCVRAVRAKQVLAIESFDHLVINGDGTITDENTGLMWQQETGGEMTWQEALNYCESSTVGGYNDWRLPTVEELRSIVDYSVYNPAIDTEFLIDRNLLHYWSGTPYAYTDSAWIIYFHYGYDDYYNKDLSYYVRAVRAGQVLIEIPDTFEITAIAEGGGGTITPGRYDVKYGETRSFNLDPEKGYKAEVNGCNGYLTPSGEIYITGTVTEPCTVTARFNETIHTVTALAEEGGTIQPSTIEVPHDEKAIFMITPDPEYSIMEISGCDGEQADGVFTTYTTDNITSPCTITARFGLKEQLGSLEVSILPDDALRVGAKWRRVDTTDWNESGTRESGIPVGQHAIEFKEIDGWRTPSEPSVTIQYGETTQITAEYQPGRQSERAAILVHPHGNDDNYDIPSIRYMLLNAWRTLEERRLTEDEIYLLSYTPFLSKTGSATPDEIVDAPVTLNDWRQDGQTPREITVDDIAAAFEWAKSRGKLEEPLIFNFAGHGIDGGLRLDPMNGILTDEALGAMLDSYQNETGNDVTVIIEACYSGTMVPVLAGTNRIIITSTKDTQAGFVDNGKGSYSRLLFSELRIGKTFFDAFQQANNELSGFQESIFKDQKPQLDDNGDGVYTDSDGLLAQQYKLNTYGDLDMPIHLISQITPGSVQPGSNFPLRVEVGYGAESVWALIVTPETIQNMDINGYPLIPAPTINLTPDEDMKIWSGEFSGFTHKGDYTVSFHAQDKKGFVYSSSSVLLTVDDGDDTIAMPVTMPVKKPWSIYKAGDTVRVRIPKAPEGFTTYAAMTIPGRGELIMLTKKNTPLLFDGISLPDFTDTDGLLLDLSIASGWPVLGSVLSTPGSAWPVGHYGVFLLQSPTGKDPLDPQVIESEWRLGVATFEVQ